MNKTEFIQGIQKIELAYNTKFTKEKLELWYSKLNYLNAKKFLERVEKLMASNKYIPNIAEIIGQESREFVDYEQRPLINIDFNSLYANKQYVRGE